MIDSEYHYVDTSAFMAYLIPDQDDGYAHHRIDRVVSQGGQLLGTDLLELEARRTAFRIIHHEPTTDLEMNSVEELLSVFVLIKTRSSDFPLAAQIGVHVTAADALHVIAAQRFEADSIITNDRNQARAAEHIGLRVL